MIGVDIHRPYILSSMLSVYEQQQLALSVLLAFTWEQQDAARTSVRKQAWALIERECYEHPDMDSFEAWLDKSIAGCEAANRTDSFASVLMLTRENVHQLLTGSFSAHA